MVVMDYVAVTKDLLKLPKFLTLVAYVLFVNGAPLLITVSLDTKFVSVKQIPTRMAKQFSKYLNGLLKYIIKVAW